MAKQKIEKPKKTTKEGETEVKEVKKSKKTIKEETETNKEEPKTRKRAKKEEKKVETEEEAKKKLEEEAIRKVAEEEARKVAEEEAKKVAEEEAKKVAEEEARKVAEEEARKVAEEEAKKVAEEEARKVAEEEARKKAEEEAKRKAEEERRKRELEEAKKKREEAEARRKAEEERRKREIEDRKKAEEEKRKAEEAKRKAEEAKRKAEEEKRKAEEEKRKAEEEKRIKAEAKRKAEEKKFRKEEPKMEINKSSEKEFIQKTKIEKKTGSDFDQATITSIEKVPKKERGVAPYVPRYTIFSGEYLSSTPAPPPAPFKREMKHAPSASEEEILDLPNIYGEDTLVSLIRDPYWLYVYWEISPQTVEKIKKQIGEEAFKQSRLVLRVYDITGLNPAEGKAHNYFDVEVNSLIGDWYINVPEPNRTYSVSIGFVVPTEKEPEKIHYYVIPERPAFEIIKKVEFIPVKETQEIAVPTDDVSEISDEHEEWVMPRHEYEKVYWLSSGYRSFIGSAEYIAPPDIARKPALKKFLEEQVSSPSLMKTTRKGGR